MLINELKKSYLGIFISIITALFAITISDLVGINLLGFKKSPLSPIIFAIVIGLIISNLTIHTVKFEHGFKFF